MVGFSTILKAVAGPLIGGISSAFGASKQNKAAQAASREQMAFQERMRSTQYQTAMADMKSAGLNPILAYKQGGAGTPGGSTYSPVNVGQAATSGAAAGGTSAIQARMAIAELDQLKALTAKTYGEEQKTAYERGLILEQTKNARQFFEINKPNATSARAADALYKSPAGDFFKWYKMLMAPGRN